MPTIKVSYPKNELNVEGMPLPKQAEFHSCGKKYRLLAGGFGTGKTMALGLESIIQMMQYPNNYGVIARKDLMELKSTTLKDLFEICPEGLIQSHDKQNKTITFINRSQLYYMNLDSAREAERKIKSLNLGLVAIDQIEEITENVFLAFIGRLRRKDTGRCFIASCNPAGHDWVWRKWIQHPYKQFLKTINVSEELSISICTLIEDRINASLLRGETDIEFAKKREEKIYGGFEIPPKLAKALFEKYNYHAIEATTFDNPYLPPDYVDQLLKYPKNWVKRYVYCSWDDFEGLVYNEFLASRNQIRPYTPATTERIYISLDYGYRNPTSVGFYAVDYDGIIRRYKEYYESGRRIDEIVKWIKEQPEHVNAIKLADPSIWNVQRDGVSVGAEFSLQGLHFERADNSVLQGINKVNEYLKAGKIKFTDNCYNLLREIGEYKWKSIRPGTQTNAAEEPVKHNDHTMDELRYLINHAYSPIKPEEKIINLRGDNNYINDYIVDTYGSDNLYASYD